MDLANNASIQDQMHWMNESFLKIMTAMEKMDSRVSAVERAFAQIDKSGAL